MRTRTVLWRVLLVGGTLLAGCTAETTGAPEVAGTEHADAPGVEPIEAADGGDAGGEGGWGHAGSGVDDS